MPLFVYAQPTSADPLKPATGASTNKSAVVKTNSSGKPIWSELTPLQQQALQPLAGTWSTISEAQKLKWLAVSKNYPSMPRDGQTTMHGRMNEWASLSPLQRAQARLNFATTKELSRQLTPEEKLVKWETYQSLSPDEKQKLVEKAIAKPAGAALAVKPVAAQKLAPVQPHPLASSAKAGRISRDEASRTTANPPTPAASAP